jgi:DNA-binding transcriptional LysR family regulator
VLDSRLTAFLTVVSQGSFTKAAEQLGLSKARVSQQVSLLEQQLGVTLLHRSTRRLLLTDVGEEFFAESQRASALLLQAESRITEDHDSIAGRIRFNSVGGIWAECHLAPAISAFMQQYPDIEVNLDYSSNRVDLLAENYDLVLRMGELEDSNLIARKLLTANTLVVASPMYFEKYGRPTTPEQLHKHRCLCGSINKWQFTHQVSGDRAEVLVSGTLTSPNGYMLRRAALDDLGIVRLNSWYLEEDLAAGNLIPAFDDWVIPSTPVSLVYRKVQYQSKRIRLLVEFLVDYFANRG